MLRNRIIKEMLLSEIGEKSITYPFKVKKEEYRRRDKNNPDKKPIKVIYGFKNRFGTDYEVTFEYAYDNGYSRDFITLGHEYEETGEGDVMNVINTVTQITVDFLNRVKPTIIVIDHIVTKKEQQKGISPITQTNSRAKINSFFLKKMVPSDYSYTLKGSTSIILKKGVDMDLSLF